MVEPLPVVCVSRCLRDSSFAEMAYPLPFLKESSLIVGEKSRLKCAGINRLEVEDERARPRAPGPDEIGFFRVEIKNPKVEKIVSLKQIKQYPSQFGPGSWIGLGAGETPLFVRDISTQEIYALDWQSP
jgi:hypothetical protein